MNDPGKAREKLVQDHIKPYIEDKRIHEAFLQVPRHLFIPEKLERKAYLNIPLPIGYGQTISQPSLVAEMTSLLKLTGKEKVLEIGTGSGYQAAILSRLAKTVISVERIPKLAEKAAKTLQALNYDNIQIITANGTAGWPEEAPYEAIIVTAGSPEVPEPLIEQLAEGGRIVIPVGGEGPEQLKVGKKKDGRLQLRDHQFVRFVPLIGEHGW